jgi:Fic family protein
MVSLSSRASLTWSPIADLPEHWEDFGRPDLDELLRYWRDERHYLAESARVRQAEHRLATRWAIETGAIERLYAIDHETTELLVDLGSAATTELQEMGRLTPEATWLIEDQQTALEAVAAHVRAGRPLTLEFCRELHSALTRRQLQAERLDHHGNGVRSEMIRGTWKRLPNTLTVVDGSIREACPPGLVQEEMDRLLGMHQRHGAMGVRPEIEAAFLHHRLTQIHPFQDGNGRVARAVAAMVFLHAGFVPPVIRHDVHREAYLDALVEADGGDLKPLIDLFANVVSADLNETITFVRSAHGRDIRSIAVAAAEATRRHVIQSQQNFRIVTEQYRKIAGARLREAAGELSNAFSAAFAGLASTHLAWIVQDEGDHAKSSEARGRWHDQIVHAASVYGYTPDFSHPRRWIALKLPVATPDALPWHVVVSFHHKLSRAGVMAAVVFLTTLEDELGGAPTTDDQLSILGGRHELTYSGGEVREERFLAWLDTALLTALEEWQARI